jgi:hypothetical protein
MKPQYDFSRARRGPIAAPAPGKTRITIRLDDAVLEWFRKRVHAEGGGNYQSLINQALLQHIAREDDVLADTLRRVLREEMAGYAVKPKGRRTARDAK